MGNLFEQKRNEIQEILKKEYDLMQSDKSNEINLEPKDRYVETASQAIIKAYNKREKGDIQSELRAYLEPTMLEKVKASLDGQDIDKIKENEQRELEKEISSVEGEGISVDGNTKKEIKKSIEERENTKETQEVNLRAEVLKAMYKTTLEEYYRLKLNLQEGYNGQLKTGDISVGDKQGTKLVLYEKYLRDIDQRYKGVAKSYIIGDDPDIKKFEEKLEKRTLYNEKNVIEKAQDNVEDIQRLYDERNDIAMRIAWLSENAGVMDPQKFDSQMDELQEEYVQASAKLHAISPSPAELKKSIEERGEDEKFRAKQLGVREMQHDKRLGVAAKEVENDEKVFDVVDDMKEQSYESSNIIVSAVDSVYESYLEAEERGNYEKAEELLQSLEEMVGIEHKEDEIEDGKEEVSDNPTYEYEGEEEVEEKESSNSYMDYLKGGTNSEERTKEIDAEKEDRRRRLETVEEKMPELKSRANEERDIGDMAYVRKRF